MFLFKPITSINCANYIITSVLFYRTNAFKTNIRIYQYSVSNSHY